MAFIHKVKKRNSIIKLITINLILFILINSFLAKVFAEEAQEVMVSVRQVPKVDVVLTRGRTSTDLSSFERNLKTRLTSQGIYTQQEINNESVKIQALSSVKITNMSSFKWKKSRDEEIAKVLDITNGGANVHMRGNRSEEGKNCIWIEPNENQDQEFSLHYDIDFGDNFNNAGMLLRTTHTGTHLKGYLLSFNNPSPRTPFPGSNTNATLYKYTYDFNNRTNFGTRGQVLEKAADLNIPISGNLTVEANSAKIRVRGGGEDKTIRLDPEYAQSDGFGFYMDQYSHGCDDIGNFELKNINLKVTTTKTIAEVLEEPEWRAGAERVMVNVEDYENRNLTEASSVTALLKSNIHFLEWGQYANRSQAETLIRSNHGKGLFTYNTNYNQAINDTAKYIEGLQKLYDSTQYVIVDIDTDITVNPENYKKGATSDKYKNGRWFIHHDYKYYDNNLGQSSQTEKYTPDLICNFDKPGKYYVKFDDKEIKEVYAHRLPVAKMEIKLENAGGNRKNVTLNSKSYDLDSNTNIGYGKGISSEKWRYKLVTDYNWTEGKITSFNTSQTYMIELEVTDNQGATSRVVQYIGNGVPVADFTIEQQQITKYKKLRIEDNSYDPEGYDIGRWTWTLFKNGSQMENFVKTNKYDCTPDINFNTSRYGIGSYKLKLVVQNVNGKTSNPYTLKFDVVPDREPPVSTVDPTNCDWKQFQDVNVTIEDHDSGLKNWRYVITETQDTPGSGAKWSSYITSKNKTITIRDNGKVYLHLEATDNDGNVLRRPYGIYHIDNIKPMILDSKVEVGRQKSKVSILKTMDNAKGSQIDNYAITDTKEVPAKKDRTKNTVYTVDEAKKYYLWTFDIAGNASEPKEVMVEIDYNLKIDPNKGKYGGNLSPTTMIKRSHSDLELSVPTRAGYDFMGWDIKGKATKVEYRDDDTNKNSKLTMGEEDSILTAKWKARNDTKYTVNHYVQNIYDNLNKEEQKEHNKEIKKYYTLRETDHLQGTTDTKVTPKTKVYEGFTAPSRVEINIDGEGTAVVDYFYKRNEYDLTIKTDDGIISTNESRKYLFDDVVNLDVVVDPGYTWAKWIGTYLRKDKKTSFNMPSKNVTEKATTTINHYTLTVKPEESIRNVPDKNRDYVIDYKSSIVLEKPFLAGYDFQGWMLEGIKSKLVYQDGDINKKAKFTMGISDSVLTAKWKARKDTKYKVNHYQQNIYDNLNENEVKEYNDTEHINKKLYTLIDTDKLEGTTDTLVRPETKYYEGFISPDRVEVNIEGDGSTVVDYFYKRMEYDFSATMVEGVKELSPARKYLYKDIVKMEVELEDGYDFKQWNGTIQRKDRVVEFLMPAENVHEKPEVERTKYKLEIKPDEKITASDEKNKKLVLKYNEALKVEKPKLDGYEFKGWVVAGKNSKLNDGTDKSEFIMGTSDSELIGKWKAKGDTEYTVNYYVQNLYDNKDKKEREKYNKQTRIDKNLYTLKQKEIYYAETNTRIKEKPLEFVGFETPDTIEALIQPDGSTVINFYYLRKEYNLTITHDDGIEESTISGKYLYGQDVELNVKVQEGYDFKSWEGDLPKDYDKKKNKFKMPAKDISLRPTAKKKFYNVYIDNDNGEDIKKIRAQYKETLHLTRPEKEGYEFLYYEKDDNSKIYDDILKVKNKDVRLKAVYAKIPDEPIPQTGEKNTKKHTFNLIFIIIIIMVILTVYDRNREQINGKRRNKKKFKNRKKSVNKKLKE